MPQTSPRHSTSFSVISSTEVSELEWFDAEGGCRSMPAGTLELLASQAASSCSETLPELIEYYERRLMQMQKEIDYLTSRLAWAEERSTTTTTSSSACLLASMAALLKDICVIGLLFQADCATVLLGV